MKALSQLTTGDGGEVRLDPGKAARFSASKQSTDGFDPPLTYTECDLPLPKTLKGTILTLQPPGIRGMSVKERSSICSACHSSARRKSPRGSPL